MLLEHRPTSEGDKLVLQLAENLVREDLTPLEAGAALARLKELRPRDWEGVAARHGINRRRAYQLMERLDDPAPLRAALEQGIIREGHAAEIRRAPAEQQADLLGEVVAHTLSVADTRSLIAGMRDEQPAPRRVARSAPPGAGAAATSARPPAGSASQTARPPSRQRQRIARAGSVNRARNRRPSARSRRRSPQPPRPAWRSGPRRGARRWWRRRSGGTAPAACACAWSGSPWSCATCTWRRLRRNIPPCPEIIVQARQARESLDAFIGLLERVQLDDAGEMERPL